MAEGNAFWEKETKVGEKEISEFSKFIVMATEKNAKKYVVIQKMYRTKKNPEWQYDKATTLPAEAFVDNDILGYIAEAVKIVRA